MLTVLGAFLFLAAVFRPLEVLFPARAAQPLLRPSWRLDLCFFLGQYLLWNGLVLGLMLQARQWLDGVVPEGFRASVAAQPWWLQMMEVLLLSDVLIYWVIGCSTGSGSCGASTRCTTARNISTGWPPTASTRSTRSTQWGSSTCPHSCSASRSRRSPASSPSVASGRSTFTRTYACRSVRCEL